MKNFGTSELDKELLNADRRSCLKIGSCGIGNEAVYLGTYFLDCYWYARWHDVKRVFKRVAMSRGGFTGKGVFGSIAYLVVQLRDGSEKACRFKYEDVVDQFLAELAVKQPHIPRMSEAAEKRIAEARAKEEARYLKQLSPEGELSVAKLREERGVLEDMLPLCEKYAGAANQKRTIDRINPNYQIFAVVIAVMALIVGLFGVWSLINRMGNAVYFVIFGFAVLLMIIGSRILPLGRSNRNAANREYEEARDAVEAALSGRELSVPARYAHPFVFDRMIRVIREGRCTGVQEAFETVKNDLKALNSSVTVSQVEYDEVVKIKPLFLINDYR